MYAAMISRSLRRLRKPGIPMMKEILHLERPGGKANTETGGSSPSSRPSGSISNKWLTLGTHSMRVAGVKVVARRDMQCMCR
jgi:hypothetical protein